jgi:lipopolysaccharide transport system permease protein
LLLVSLPLGLRPGVTWLLLPLPLLALQALGFAIGLLCGTLNVFFRDVGQLLGVALQIVLWTAPIVYPASALPDRVRPLLAFHPLVPPLDTIRDLFLYHRVPGPATWVGLVAWPVVVLLAARVTFGALREEIRDLL